MELLFLLVIITDGMVIGAIISALCERLLGNSPLARLCRLLLCITGGILYAYMCISLAYGETELSMGMFLFVVLAPVALLLLMLVVKYMFKDSESNNGGQ